MSSSTSTAPPLDFAALLSRDYRPARVARLIPHEKGGDLLSHKKKDADMNGDAVEGQEHHHHHHPTPKKDVIPDLLVEAGEDYIVGVHSKHRHHHSQHDDGASSTPNGRPGDEETNRLVFQLVTKTPVYARHLQQHKKGSTDPKIAATAVDDSALRAYMGKNHSEDDNANTIDMLSPLFHQVELGNWESKISWEGYQPDNDDSNGKKDVTAGSSSDNTQSKQDRPSEATSTALTTTTATVGNGTGNKDSTSRAIVTAKQLLLNPSALLQNRRNPFLENLSFDMVSWSGDKDDVAQKAASQPLILELGVAGQSIARHVLPAHRPEPHIKSMAYQRRIEDDWDDDDMPTSAELIAKGSLHADKDKMERLIAQRQEKRRQMAKDKTNRVTEAMGTLDGVLGGGRGRTITSSLMGPGGTERTGRPSRHVGNVNHDTEYIEQLDMVGNHVLVRDLSKVALRQYHRPKLPLTVVRTTLYWQFQIRHAPTGKKGTPTAGGGGDTANSSSYQAMMMGTHAGAISKAKLRTESDLSPTEGNLVLLEYSEERPPIQLTKGMASKIVTYYRGDKSRCPVSAGGGDRPTRRKRPGGDGATEQEPTNTSSQSQNKVERPPRLVGPHHAIRNATITDYIGKAPKKTREDRNSEKASINVLPEGVTEVLHPKVHGPFIGEIEEGQSLTGLISNLFVAPLFRHEPESTDFLMILGRNAGATVPGRHESLGVVLRDLPSSVFTVGQTEPRSRVFAPNTQGEKNFIGPFVSYQIAKALARTEAREGHGLRFDEIQDRVLPNLGLPPNALRQRLKQVAIYDKNTQIWTTKSIGYEDYPGVDSLGKNIPPEGVAAYEVSASSVRRLNDLGIHQLYAGSHAVSSVGVTMVYLAGQKNAARELARKAKKQWEFNKTNKKLQGLQITYYERAANELDTIFKSLRSKHEVAKFIYEELQLAPWHLTGEFIEVHKKGEGTGMMKLTGLGDPSGVGEGFSFLREVDSKPSKSFGVGPINAQNAQMKKITGTEDDLRKLTMKQMAKILRSYGMAQKQIDTLKRWDRVHVIRDLSTKAASDGIGDGLERFARGEKMKLSEQKQMYRDRIQLISKRQIAALSAESSEGRGSGADGAGVGGDADEPAASRPAQQSKEDAGKEESDSESEDDEFAAAMEEEMMDRPEANQLVADQARDAGVMGGDTSLGQLRNAAQDQDLTKDARELAALKKQREEERAAREGSALPTAKASWQPSQVDRKVIRKKIVKTYPDGRQTTTFKFIVHPDEVGTTMARLQQKKDSEKEPKKEKPEYQPDERQIGHSMFEDDDDFEYTTRGRNQMLKRRGAANRRARQGATAKAPPRKKDFQFGKLKNKVSKEQRLKKRKRDEEEAELYSSVAKRKGTSNRKERGSIRERRPHVILADRLEAIRATIESRPTCGPFIKPVSRRDWPHYYEKISHPIDLSTIRDKIQKYEYRTADAMLKDFSLMKSNAIKFNGSGTLIAEEGAAIYQLVKDKIDESRSELTHLEEAVKEQMSEKPKKKKKKGGAKATSPTSSTAADIEIPEDLSLVIDSDSD